ncbi:MFS-type transporter [Fulvia fulva]|nr:MFS-type transporter [Fulvia fulva]KAK4618783.1 MFS-type transporter [Fulvia fulva]WPV18236.1 MFS-type transporter [Fulvia fulva]WPV33561.1 MFS-type transporter [Fulvia fulva]
MARPILISGPSRLSFYKTSQHQEHGHGMAKATAWAKLLNTLQIKTHYSIKPAGLTWRSNTFFIVSTVAVGLFTDLFLYGLIVPVLPFMLQHRIGLPQEQVQSHVSGLLAAYAAASVLFSPIAGVLADRVSTRQAPFLFGLAALLAATVLLFLGRSVPVLVLARVLQGISAGFVWTIGLALCLETVGPENLGKTIGSIFSFIAVGNLAAPLLGGVLYKKTGYTGVFAIGASILVVDFIMRIMVIEKKTAMKYEVDDPSTVNDLSAARSHDQQNDEQDEESQQQDGSANGEEEPLLGGQKPDDEYYRLPPREKCSKATQLVPILPLLSDPMLLTALMVAFVQAVLLGAFDSTIPTVAGELFGFDSLKAGLLFLPLGAFDLVGGPIFGWCVDRYGTKPVAVLAYAFLVPVLVLLRIPQAGGKEQIIIYAALLSLSGVGLAGVGSPSIVEAGAIVQKYYEVNPDFFGDKGPYAQLYSCSNIAFCLGLAIGPELAGELKQAIGYGNMNMVLAGLCAFTSFLSFIYIGGKPKSRILKRASRNTYLARRRA